MHVISKFILASTAEHRKKILATTGLKFSVAIPGDEIEITTENPVARAKERSIFKALSVSKQVAESVVLGADQVLECDGEIFSKPDCVATARRQLQFLSGKTHILHSGWALCAGDKALQAGVTACVIEFRTLKSEEIESYLKTSEWRNSCGSYKYEGAGVNLMKSVKGEYAAIVGLPLTEILHALRELNINPLLQPHPPWYLV